MLLWLICESVVILLAYLCASCVVVAVESLSVCQLCCFGLSVYQLCCCGLSVCQLCYVVA